MRPRTKSRAAAKTSTKKRRLSVGENLLVSILQGSTLQRRDKTPFAAGYVLSTRSGEHRTDEKPVTASCISELVQAGMLDAENPHEAFTAKVLTYKLTDKGKSEAEQLLSVEKEK